MNLSYESSFLLHSTQQQDLFHLEDQESDANLKDSTVMRHDYRDYSTEVGDNSSLSRKRPGSMPQFPIKLHTLLEVIENDGYSHIISWQPHGRCFVIHKPKEFSEHIMPLYFKQSKLPSFQRQLNLYGFQRLTKGPDKGGYYHELFLRGKIFLAERMKRIRIKGNGVRAKSNPDAEPDFQSMNPIPILSRSSMEVVTKEDPQDYVKIHHDNFLYSEENVVYEQNMEQSCDEKLPRAKQDSAIIMDNEFGGMKLFPLLGVSECQHDTTALGDDSNSQQLLMKFLQHLNFSLDLYSDIVEIVDNDKDYADLILKLIQ
jgi:hypothetical protein